MQVLCEKKCMKILSQSFSFATLYTPSTKLREDDLRSVCSQSRAWLLHFCELLHPHGWMYKYVCGTFELHTQWDSRRTRLDVNKAHIQRKHTSIQEKTGQLPYRIKMLTCVIC